MNALILTHEEASVILDEHRRRNAGEAKELDRKELDSEENSLALAKTLTKRPDFLFTANPVLCGTFAHQTLLQLATVGRQWADGCGAVVDVCHLYNALRQNGLLQSSWAEVEKVTELQIGAFFGGKLPDAEPRYAIHRYGSHVFGFSATTFSRAMRPGNSTSKITQKQGYIKYNEILEAYRELYGGNKSEMVFIAELEQLSRQSKQRKPWAKPQESQTQVLKEMKEMIPRSLEDCKINMITLTRHCYEVLVHIGNHCMGSFNFDGVRVRQRNQLLMSTLLTDLGHGLVDKPKLAAKIMQEYIDKIVQEGEKNRAENCFISLTDP
jgi:hypothetical protein